MRSAYKIIILKHILEDCIWRCGMSLIKTVYDAVAEFFQTVINILGLIKARKL